MLESDRDGLQVSTIERHLSISVARIDVTVRLRMHSRHGWMVTNLLSKVLVVWVSQLERLA